MNQEKTRKIGIWFLALFFFAAHFLVQTAVHADEGSQWNKTVSRTGDCTIHFPSTPQMMQQSLKVTEAGDRLHYDVYLAPFEDKAVCLLLIAQYPSEIPPGQELRGLEGLLNGIVGHSQDNQLVFANVFDLKGIPAVDFLVQNGSSYFRGMALMVGSKLYLIAMEGKQSTRDEKVFSRFSKSFQLYH